jgi:hypothetical protein
MYDSMDNLSLKQLKYIIPIFLIGAFILYYLLGKVTEDTFKQFPLIKTGETVNSIVIETKDYKGSTLLKDSNGKSYSVRAFNWKEKVSVLHYHLEQGDSISRKAYSDTLYLYKKKEGTVIEFEIQCLE